MTKRKPYIRKAGSPTLSSVQADPVLTNVSIAYSQAAEGFAHAAIFPTVPVEEETGKYWKFPRDEMFRSEAAKRAPGTPANRKTIAPTKGTFKVEQWALDADLPDEMRTSRGSPFQDDSMLVELITQDLLIQRELQFVSSFLQTSLWGVDAVGVASGPSGDQFVQFDATGAAIIKVMQNQVQRVKRECGRKPNTLMLARNVWDAIRNDADVIGRQIYVSDRPVEAEWFANLVGVEKIVIGDAIQNTAKEGDAFAGSDIISNLYWLGYVDPSPALNRPTAGLTLSWPEFDEIAADMVGANGMGAAIKTWRNEDLGVDRFRGHMSFDMVISSAASGLLATNVLGSP